MRVLIAHSRDHSARALRQAAYACWGGPQLVQMALARAADDITAQLSDQRSWPDVVLASLSLMEEPDGPGQLLQSHAARQTYCLVIVATNQDELDRAWRDQHGDAVVAAPVTAQRLAQALRQLVS